MWLSKQFVPQGSDVKAYVALDVAEEEDDATEDDHFEFRREIENLVRARNNIASALFQRNIDDETSYKDSIMQYPLTVGLIKGLEGAQRPKFNVAYAEGQWLRIVLARTRPWLPLADYTLFGEVILYDEGSQRHRMRLIVPKAYYNAIRSFGLIEGNWDVFQFESEYPAEHGVISVVAWVDLDRVLFHQPEIQPVFFNEGSACIFAASRLTEFAGSVHKNLSKQLRLLDRDRRRHGTDRLADFIRSSELYDETFGPEKKLVRQLHHQLWTRNEIDGDGCGVFCCLTGDVIPNLLFTNGGAFEARPRLQRGRQSCGRWVSGKYLHNDRIWTPVLLEDTVDIIVNAAPINKFQRRTVLRRSKEAGGASVEVAVGQGLVARDHVFAPDTTKTNATAASRCRHCHQPQRRCEAESKGSILVDVRFKAECMDLLFEAHWGGPRHGWQPPSLHVRGRPEICIDSHEPHCMLPLAPRDDLLDSAQTHTSHSKSRRKHDEAAAEPNEESGRRAKNRWSPCVRCLTPAQRVLLDADVSLRDSVVSGKSRNGEELKMPTSGTVHKYCPHDGTYEVVKDNAAAEHHVGSTETTASSQSNVTHVDPGVSFDLRAYNCFPLTVVRYLSGVRLSVFHPGWHRWEDATVDRWLGPDHGNRHFLRFDAEPTFSVQVDLHDCNHAPLLLNASHFEVGRLGFLGWTERHLSKNFTMGGFCG